MNHEPEPCIDLCQVSLTVLLCHVSSAVEGGLEALAAVLPCVRPAMALAALRARDGFVPRGPSSRDLLEGGRWPGRVVVWGVGLGGI